MDSYSGIVFSTGNFSRDYQILLVQDFAALAVIIFLFWVINRSRLPKSWDQFFKSPYSLKYYFRQALAGVFSRWWILVVPLVLFISSSMELKFINRIQTKLNPEILVEHQKSCEKYSKSSEQSMDKLKANLSATLYLSVINSLSSPIQMENLPFGLASILIISVLLLIWTIISLRKKAGAMQQTQKIVTAIFVICSLLLIIVIPFNFIKYIWFITPGKNVDFSDMLQPSLIYLGLSSIYSIWFVLLFEAGMASVGNSHSDDRESIKRQTFELTLKVFPVFLIINFGMSLLSFPWTFIIPDKLNYLLYQIPTSKILGIVLAWCFYPLPFIIARHDLNLRNAFSFLLKIWRHHFIKLLTLAFIVFFITVLAGIILLYYKFTLHHPIQTIEQCLEASKLEIYPMVMVIGAVCVAIQTVLFMLLVKVFSSGALDLPIENSVLDDTNKGPSQKEPE